MSNARAGLLALTTDGEYKEVTAIGTIRKPVTLRYRGQMRWSKQYGIDSRMWDVVAPVMPRYDYSSGGYPTLTTEGLKKEGII